MAEYHPGTPRNSDGTCDLSNVLSLDLLPGNCLRPLAALPSLFDKKRITNWRIPHQGDNCPTWIPLEPLIGS